MKYFFILLVQAGFLLPLSAQSVLSVFPDTAYIANPPSSFDNPAKAEVVNTGNSTITLQWRRFGIEVPAGIYTQVCDPGSCWPASVNAFSFELPAGDTANMDMHFVNENGLAVPPFAQARIKVWVDGNPADSAIILYRYTTQSVSATQVELPDLTISPNPGADFFILKNTEESATLTVFQADGKILKHGEVVDGQRFNAAGLPEASYQIVLKDRNGRILRVLNWQKR